MKSGFAPTAARSFLTKPPTSAQTAGRSRSRRRATRNRDNRPMKNQPGVAPKGPPVVSKDHPVDSKGPLVDRKDLLVDQAGHLGGQAGLLVGSADRLAGPEDHLAKKRSGPHRTTRRRANREPLFTELPR